jgi:hypothetical protein
MYIMTDKLRQASTNEICSLLLDYITNHLSYTAKELYVISDCSGQNGKHIIVRFLTKLPANGRFKKLFPCFPVILDDGDSTYL